MSPSVHVDRREELALFEAIIAGSISHRGLLVTARPPSDGMGKTALLKAFRKAVSSSSVTRMGCVDLKGADSVLQILEEFCVQLDGPFSRFHALRLQVLRPHITTVIENSRLRAVSFDIRTGTEPAADHSAISAGSLTEAFIADLDEYHDCALGQITVIAFDTFEAANASVQRWVGSHLLPRLQSRPWLVLVVAGNEIPDLDLQADDLCELVVLEPLDIESVSEYLQMVGLGDSAETSRFVYAVTNGRPLEVVTIAAKLLSSLGMR